MSLFFSLQRSLLAIPYATYEFIELRIQFGIYTFAAPLMMSRGSAIDQAVRPWHPRKDVLEHLQQQNGYCSNFLHKYIVIAISEISTFVLKINSHFWDRKTM
jgi:hypothetical protein